MTNEPTNSKNDLLEHAVELRRRAEEISRKRIAGWQDAQECLSLEETRKMLHELQVHQIELEMQNEELRRSQAGLGIAKDRYFDLYNLVPVGYVTVSEKGLILEANLTSTNLLGMDREALIKKPLTRFILKEDQDIYYLRGKQLLETGLPQVFELRMVKKDATVFWARLNVTKSQDLTDTILFLIVLTDITERKQAAEALRQSENRFRNLFEKHSAVKLILDAETGSIIDANQAAALFYGWPIDALKQMRIQQINTLPPEVVKAKMEKVGLSEGASFEFRHCRADGSIRDVEVFTNRIEIAGKSLLYSIIHDITERKWAEEALREEEHYLRTILQTTADGFLIVDIEGKIYRVNEAYSRMSGYTCEELLKLDISSIDSVEKPAEIMARINRIVANGSEIFEARHRRKDGSVFRVEISVTYIKTGGGKFVCFCRDITERKQTEEMLKKNQEEIQIILDASPIMIFYKDCENRFIRVNKRLAEVTGLPKEAMEGKTVFDIYPNQAKDYWEDDKEVIASGMPKNGIVEPVDTPTGPRWVQSDKIPYRDKDGRIIGIIGFAVDITERTQAETALWESEERFRTLATLFPSSVGLRMLRAGSSGTTSAGTSIPARLLNRWKDGDGSRFMIPRSCLKSLNDGRTRLRPANYSIWYFPSVAATACSGPF